MTHIILTATAILMLSAAAFANDHVGVMASDQSVSGGTVTATKVMAAQNGWLVVHKTDRKKPGPVIGHAPLKKGTNNDVTAILTEKVKSGDKLMLMFHEEKGGSKTGIFEYTLGSTKDGPIKPGGKLVMKIVTAK